MSSLSGSALVDGLLGHAPRTPERIVCLTEETTEILYAIGEGHRVVGVSGYTLRPKEARKKPKVSSFLDANFDRILELKPDLVLGFSDLQKDLARELIERGVPTYVFNQRSIAEILQTIVVVSGLVGAQDRGLALAQSLEKRLRSIAETSAKLPRRPRVFFEEWPDPLIANIRWVGELVEIAGGDDLGKATREEQGAKGRFADAEAIAAKDPEVIIASWCGKKAQPDVIRSRAGFASTTAVSQDQLYEIKSVYILQPGPAALTEGVNQLARIIAAVANGEHAGPPRKNSLRRADVVVDIEAPE